MGAEQCLLDMAVPNYTHMVGVVSHEKAHDHSNQNCRMEQEGTGDLPSLRNYRQPMLLWKGEAIFFNGIFPSSSDMLHWISPHSRT